MAFLLSGEIDKFISLVSLSLSVEIDCNSYDFLLQILMIPYLQFYMKICFGPKTATFLSMS